MANQPNPNRKQYATRIDLTDFAKILTLVEYKTVSDCIRSCISKALSTNAISAGRKLWIREEYERNVADLEKKGCTTKRKLEM